jgi:hypothetical protein
MCRSFKFGVAGVIIGTVSLGFTVYNQIKVHKANKNIELVANIMETSVDKISRDIPIDVSQEMVDRAITRAVDREVSSAVSRATNEVIYSLKVSIQNDVRTAVKDAASDIRGSVSNEISIQAANLDIRKLQDEVRDKAKQHVLEKFDNKLDDLVDEFKTNLQNITKIYSSVAGTMGQKSDGETVIRLKV